MNNDIDDSIMRDLESHGYNGNISKNQQFIGELDPSRTAEQSIAYEHGSTGPTAPQSFIGELDPSRTVEQSIMYEHGADAYQTKQTTYGTDKEEEIKIMRDLSLADGVDTNALNELISKLPDEALYKVVSKRFKDSANIMDDKYGLNVDRVNQLGERLNTDFNVVLTLIAQNRNLEGKNIDASIYMGADKTNVAGLLGEYQKYIQGTGKTIPLLDFKGNPILGANNEEMKAEDLLNIVRIKAQEKSPSIEMDGLGKTM